MEEQLITFETAELAKEKGFNIPLSMAYHIPSKTLTVAFSSISNDKRDNHHCTAPTQSLLQRWLREKHNIEVYVEPTYICKLKEYQAYYGYINHLMPVTGKIGGYIKMQTYEQAFEKGLQEALKLIKYGK